MFHYLLQLPWTRKPAHQSRGRKPFRPILERMEDRWAPAVIDWTLPAGMDGNFNVAANWTVRGSNPPDHRVPGPGDDAVIDRPNNVVTISEGHTINSLSDVHFGSAARLQITGGTFSVAADSTFGNLTLSSGATVRTTGGTAGLNGGGTIAGSLDAEGTSTLKFTGGQFDFAAPMPFTGPGQYVVDGGQFNVDFVDLTGPLNFGLASGSLTGAKTFTIPSTGMFTWTGGTMAGNGRTTVYGSLTMEEGGTKYFETRTLELDGPTTWWGGDITVVGAGGGQIINNAGQLFDIHTDAGVFEGLFPNPPPTFTNLGTLRKSFGLGETRFEHLVFNNGGTVLVQSGTLSLETGGTSSGTFDTAAGAGLYFAKSFFSSSTYTLTNGANFIDPGFVHVTGGTVDVEGAVTATNFTLDSGTLTGTGILEVVAGGTFDWTGGTIQGSNFVLTLDPEATMTIDGTANKTLAGSTLALNGGVSWSGGNIAFQNRGIMNLGEGQGDGTFTIDTDNLSMSGSGTFRNKGTVTMAGSFSNVTITGIMFINDDPAAVLSLARGSTLAIANFTQSAGETDVAAGASLVTSSTVTLQNSTLDDNGSLTVSTGDLVLNQGAVLSGVGFVTVHNATGKVDNVAGTVCPGECDGSVIGTLTIAGNYVNEALGTVDMYIDGTDPSSYDQLVVTGTVTLNGGTMHITFGSDYVPTDQDSFKKVLCSDLEVINGNPGDFEVYNVSNLDPSFQMTHAIDNGCLTLTVSAVGGAPGRGGRHGRHGLPMALSEANPAVSENPFLLADTFFQIARRYWEGGWIDVLS